uniref:Sodium/potassium/calcium exchanger 1 n=1 Tax=Monopterus albus TaxID=43700 RepID=A0A3Q3QDR4_MONAL
MNVHSPLRRRLRRSRILLFLSGVLLCLVYTLTEKARLSQPGASLHTDEALGVDEGDDDVLEINIREVMASNKTEEQAVSPESTKPPLVIMVNRTDIEQCIYVDPQPSKPLPTPPPLTTTALPRPPLQPPHRKGDYPEDIFSVEQRRQGWVVLHVIGMTYMFVALAIVCDEFFVPALEVITTKLEISDDVAGATFMAAGGSAPELFTSLIGVFISHSNVGIGTIVGSAVFNILFVIGIISLVLGYISYVSFMKFNSPIEQKVKTQLNKHMSTVKVWTTEEPEKVRPALQRGGSLASLHNTSLRSTIFQLMIHTLDPLGEGGGAAEPSTSQPPRTEEMTEKTSDQPDESEEKEEENEPLSLAWPVTRRKQATYLFLLPIVFPLWLTLPDVRSLASRKYFALTFIGSILWIGVFSYLMVWWAHQVGETVGLSEEIMGLTILAAGTSIPDLITSVIVARKGLGDMAVSSSVGSNIFDITVGLPVPWLMYTLVHNGEPVAVSSNGLFCTIVLLFLMLLFVIISIATCRWKMSRMLGLTMFVLYFVFLVLSVLLELRIFVCPVSI